MEPRADLRKATPNVRKVYQAMLAVEGAINAGGLESSLLNLIRMRASQINGCAYCLDMHSKDLRAAGETEQRIYCLEAWRETPFYTERERAALAWTEAVTDLNDGHVTDEVYEQVRPLFTEEELELLTAAIAAINFWNRLSISLRAVPGEYQPAHRPKGRGQEAMAPAC
jgi:AhpD family alkylhydroperoxidase